MRGYFDDEEEEPERPRRDTDQRDTELTLGSGALLAMFFGLVVICGLCFGLGYAVGRHGSSPAAANPAHTAAPDQEPLQGNGSIPKPSPLARAPVLPPSNSRQMPETDAGASPGTPQQSPSSGQGGSPAGAPAGTAQTQVRPAMPAMASTPQAAAPPSVRPALPAVPLMVQIAAVSNPEDASVLMNSLRKRGYPVTASREPEDRLIHVRIGPYYSRDEATRMCMRLLNDGYNAMIQP